jgi:hypothetical protein
MTAQEKKGKFNTKLLSAIIILIIVVSISIVAADYALTQQNPKNSQLPAMSLVIVGSDGTTKTLNETEIAAFASYTGQGASRSGNEVGEVATYTGIAVKDLLNLVGGMTAGQTLTVIAQDSYKTTYNYQQVMNGQDITTYDISGNIANLTQSLKLALIYYREGAPLASDDGPLMMGVLGNEGLATAGNQWAKMVVKLQVNPASTPAPTASPTSRPTSTPTPGPLPIYALTPTPTPTPITISATEVTIIGSDNSTVTLNQNNLITYIMTYGLGGKYKSANGIFDYGTYSGVSMTTLLNIVGGMSSGQVLCVKGADNYVKNYTYTEVTGTGLTMYDPATVAVATPAHPVTMILAYHLNSTSINLPSYTDGSYMMVSFVGADGYATIANMFAKYVVEIRVYNQ